MGQLGPPNPPILSLDQKTYFPNIFFFFFFNVPPWQISEQSSNLLQI